MRNSNLRFKEEILEKALNPDRIFKLMEEYNKEEVYKNYF